MQHNSREISPLLSFLESAREERKDEILPIVRGNDL
jgi:hypothetical protein